MHSWIGNEDKQRRRPDWDALRHSEMPGKTAREINYRSEVWGLRQSLQSWEWSAEGKHWEPARTLRWRCKRERSKSTISFSGYLLGYKITPWHRMQMICLICNMNVHKWIFIFIYLPCIKLNFVSQLGWIWSQLRDQPPRTPLSVFLIGLFGMGNSILSVGRSFWWPPHSCQGTCESTLTEHLCMHTHNNNNT